MKEADQLGLFIFDKNPSGESVIRHSMRLKAFRDAQQLIEYLNLLATKSHWSHAQMQEFVSHYVPLDAEVEKIDDADAGTSKYGEAKASGVESLRLAIAELLRS